MDINYLKFGNYRNTIVFPKAVCKTNNQLKNERSGTLEKSNIPIGYFAHKHGFKKRKTVETMLINKQTNCVHNGIYE